MQTQEAVNTANHDSLFLDQVSPLLDSGLLAFAIIESKHDEALKPIIQAKKQVHQANIALTDACASGDLEELDLAIYALHEGAFDFLKAVGTPKGWYWTSEQFVAALALTDAAKQLQRTWMEMNLEKVKTPDELLQEMMVQANCAYSLAVAVLSQNI